MVSVNSLHVFISNENVCYKIVLTFFCTSFNELDQLSSADDIDTAGNGTVENSLLFKKVFIGSNCVVKNSIIMDDVYLGDNTYIENCVVESGTTIRANTVYKGEGEIKVVVENSERYHI